MESEPILRVKASGLKGSGYKIVTQLDANGRAVIVPGVTTVTNISHKPALVQWACDQTAAYAATHIDQLLNRSELEGYAYLRYRWKREPKLDADPNMRNWHEYVLNDAADMGRWGHAYVESDLLNEFGPEVTEDWQQEIADQWAAFKFEHDIEVGLVEATVYNPIGYAGTFDLLVKIDGVWYLLDIKTSRGTWPEHYMQLAALGAAPVYMRQTTAFPYGNYERMGEDDGPTYFGRIEETGEVAPIASWLGENVMLDFDGVLNGVNGSFVTLVNEPVLYKRTNKPDTWWVEDVLPSFTKYAILHIRPTDDDKEAFCVLNVVDQGLIDLHYEWFLGHLTAKNAQRSVEQYLKAVAGESPEEEDQ